MKVEALKYIAQEWLQEINNDFACFKCNPKKKKSEVKMVFFFFLKVKMGNYIII